MVEGKLVGSVGFCPFERVVQTVYCVFDGSLCDCVLKDLDADVLVTGCLGRDFRGKLLYVCPRYDADFRLLLIRFFGLDAGNIFRVVVGDFDCFVFYSSRFYTDCLLVVANDATRKFYG